jgi:hypothetical protein
MVAQVDGDKVYIDTEQAVLAFVKGARQIPGVSVTSPEGCVPTEASILVVVPDMFGDVADKVYELEVLVRKQYKHARLKLDVQSRDIHELEALAE